MKKENSKKCSNPGPLGCKGGFNHLNSIFCDRQIKEAPLSKSEKTFEHLGSPQLSNMNHTILHTICSEWHVEHNFVVHTNLPCRQMTELTFLHLVFNMLNTIMSTGKEFKHGPKL